MSPESSVDSGHGAGRPHFQAQLRGLEEQTLGGLDLVVEQVERVAHALADQDIGLAELVIANDDKVDGRYIEVHQSLLSLLALQAPVAGDLRLVAALLHVLRCMERMGDQCVNIAKVLPLSGHNPPARAEVVERLVKMADAAKTEVLQSKVAFAKRDVELAEDLVRRDREINRLNKEIFHLAVEAGVDPDTREWGMHMILVARALERIGDNAVDIGEQTVFVVTGSFSEFSDSSHPLGPSPATTGLDEANLGD